MSGVGPQKDWEHSPSRKSRSRRRSERSSEGGQNGNGNGGRPDSRSSRESPYTNHSPHRHHKYHAGRNRSHGSTRHDQEKGGRPGSDQAEGKHYNGLAVERLRQQLFHMKSPLRIYLHEKFGGENEEVKNRRKVVMSEYVRREFGLSIVWEQGWDNAHFIFKAKPSRGLLTLPQLIALSHTHTQATYSNLVYKSGLLKTGLRVYGDKWFEIHPYTWIWRGPENNIVPEEQAEYTGPPLPAFGNKWWITKPAAGTYGYGLHMLTLTDLPTVTKRGHVVQKYLEHPFLLSDGHKFDLRVYIWVTEEGLFLMKDPWIRRCAKSFQLETWDPEIHISNTIVNNSHVQPVGKFPELSGWLPKRVEEFFGVLAPLFYTEVPQSPQRVHRFQCFGVDLILDRDKRLWLLEVNGNPNWKYLDERYEQLMRVTCRVLFDKLLPLPPGDCLKHLPVDPALMPPPPPDPSTTTPATAVPTFNEFPVHLPAAPHAAYSVAGLLAPGTFPTAPSPDDVAAAAAIVASRLACPDDVGAAAAIVASRTASFESPSSSLPPSYSLSLSTASSSSSPSSSSSSSFSSSSNYSSSSSFSSFSLST